MWIILRIRKTDSVSNIQYPIYMFSHLVGSLWKEGRQKERLSHWLAVLLLCMRTKRRCNKGLKLSTRNTFFDFAPSSSSSSYPPSCHFRPSSLHSPLLRNCSHSLARSLVCCVKFAQNPWTSVIRHPYSEFRRLLSYFCFFFVGFFGKL